MPMAMSCKAVPNPAPIAMPMLMPKVIDDPDLHFAGLFCGPVSIN
jgi:hypothetical protein